MATSEEKQELVETIKGPRFYRIQLWGYGGEAEYMHLTKNSTSFGMHTLKNTAMVMLFIIASVQKMESMTLMN